MSVGQWLTALGAERGRGDEFVIVIGASRVVIRVDGERATLAQVDGAAVADEALLAGVRDAEGMRARIVRFLLRRAASGEREDEHEPTQTRVPQPLQWRPVAPARRALAGAPQPGGTDVVDDAYDALPTADVILDPMATSVTEVTAELHAAAARASAVLRAPDDLPRIDDADVPAGDELLAWLGAKLDLEDEGRPRAVEDLSEEASGFDELPSLPSSSLASASLAAVSLASVSLAHAAADFESEQPTESSLPRGRRPNEMVVALQVELQTLCVRADLLREELTDVTARMVTVQAALAAASVGPSAAALPRLAVTQHTSAGPGPTVLVVDDDHARQRLREVLAGRIAGLTVAATVDDVLQRGDVARTVAVVLVRPRRSDVVAGALRRLRSAAPAAKVLVLTNDVDPDGLLPAGLFDLRVPLSTRLTDVVAQLTGALVRLGVPVSR